MEVTKVPFAKKVGLAKSPAGNLMLDFDESNQNHLQTMHASALFTLAESASGEALQLSFPELVDKVVPVVRDSQISFKKPALTKVTAFTTISDETILNFKEQMMRKKRSTIAVDVTVKDENQNVVCIASFKWFVQLLA